MRKMMFLAAGAVIFALSGPAMAQQTTAPQDSASHPDPNETICKSGKAPIGSRIPAPPECHTRAQWAQMQEDAQKDLDHMQTAHPQAGNSGG